MTTDLLTAIDVEQLLAIDHLLGAYCEVVDAQDWPAWPELFADDCSYLVQTLDNAERGLPLAYMLDDGRARLLDRVKFITEVWAGTIEPYRTRHVAQRTAVRPLDAQRWAVRSSFQVSYSELDQPAGILAAGRYEDVVVRSGAGMAFAERRVMLDGMPSRYLVYPL